MVLSQIIERLDGVKPYRKGYIALCPAHPDQDPSLSIDEGEDGRILLKCFAGCPTEEIVGAIGIEMADLFPEKPSGNGSRQMVATYNYLDEAGNLLYQVCRFEPKDFRQRRPDGFGGWVWKLGNTQRVLYHLPELLAADPSEWVFVVEGEKDADKLMSLGLVATTNPGGADKWRDEYSETLAGRRVCVLPDNDTAGKKHAWDIVSSLNGKASEARILELEDLPPKGDISNWLSADHTVEELLTLLKLPPTEPKPSTISPEKPFHYTDWGNARRLVSLHGENLRFCHVWGKWLIWNERCWEIDETEEIVRRAKETVTTIYQEAANTNEDNRKSLAKWAIQSEGESRLRAMISLAQSEPGIPVRVHQLDTDPWLLSVRNGVLDLRSGELRKHCQENLITRTLEEEFYSQAECPTWTAFLEKILEGNTNLITFLQRAVGYSLTGSTREQCLFILYGTGANGKSTFLNTLQELLGDLALQTPTETLLIKRGDSIPNDLARLPGARLVVSIETEDGAQLAESRVKQMTGGEPVVARFLHKEFFEFKPVFKLWLATNHKPTIKGTDHAIWRRIRLIPFNMTIPEEEQDTDLPEKLRTEFPGILRWAVEGCLSWQKEGIHPPQEVSEATTEYQAEQDVLAGFLRDVCVEHPFSEITKKEFYAAYKEWCEENGDKPESQRAISRRMKERGFQEKKGTGGTRKWIGVGKQADHLFEDGYVEEGEL